MQRPHNAQRTPLLHNVDIHNNPVKHGYVKKWVDWAYSSYHWYLENKGRDWLVELWQEYPLLNYGDKWDDL